MFKYRLKRKDDINPIMTKEGSAKTLEQKISDASSLNSNTTEDDTEIKDITDDTDSEEEEKTHSDYSKSSIDVDDDLDTVNTASSEAQEEEQAKEEERKILKMDAEKKAQEYAEKSLKQMINGDNLLEGMETFMQSVRDLPEKIYEENFENYAIVLSNTTINGEKIFNDVEEAKRFITKIRNGAKTPKKYIKPRAYKQFKEEAQKRLQLTPMISRNVKNRTNAINVYQY